MLRNIDNLSPNTLRDYQISFVGGMRWDIDPTRLVEDQYVMVINGRTRDDVVAPVKLPTQLTQGVPPSDQLFQGVYAAGSYAILFASGKAYFRDFANAGTSFTPIPGAFDMNPVADRLYAELVPASTINFQRSAANANAVVSLAGLTDASPQALLVQDGTSQPRLVLADGTTRITQDFSQWLPTLDKREYVPVGKQMMMGDDGKLYIINGRNIYHSVTGRPLDFVLAVDSAGNKLSEPASNADALAYRPDFDDVTAISKIGAEGFYIGTAKNSYIIQATDRTIYGEPVFRRRFLFSTGPLNNFSLADILGDTALIDASGIRSFNSVLQTQNEGRNAPFSKEIHSLLQGIVQTTTAAITFDNYALFSVSTRLGPAILVYDTHLAKWVGLDIYPGVGLIKQFCEIKLTTGKMLLFITTDNKLYQAFTGSTATTQLYTREFSTGDPEVQFKPDFLHPVFIDAVETGTVTVTPFVNRRSDTPVLSPIVATIPTNPIPQTPPFGIATVDTVNNDPVKFLECAQGWKVGFLITWNCQASLSHLSVVATSQTGFTNLQSQAKQYA